MNGLLDIVLLVCSDAERAEILRDRLFEEGFHVIGPASTAAMAMALAAQTLPTVAVVAKPPTGRRNAVEFARDLMRTWGVGSVILSEATDRLSRTPHESRWRARPNQVARLRRALTGRGASSPSPAR
ncbi:hypothetical protein ACO2Q3_24055 [Caulobacter sp. KR2-114]|uniref:hypothetical protein n=1 Tax=Caulobacter sp. KR2-114 TaxID=3400912 RepID=UPI003C0CF2FF